jgi:hypothetical protein
MSGALIPLSFVYIIWCLPPLTCVGEHALPKPRLSELIKYGFVYNFAAAQYYLQANISVEFMGCPSTVRTSPIQTSVIIRVRDMKTGVTGERN